MVMEELATLGDMTERKDNGVISTNPLIEVHFALSGLNGVIQL